MNSELLWSVLQVTQVKAYPIDCTTALQIGCGSKKAKRLHPTRQSYFIKNDLPFKAKLVRSQLLYLALSRGISARPVSEGVQLFLCVACAIVVSACIPGTINKVS